MDDNASTFPFVGKNVKMEPASNSIATGLYLTSMNDMTLDPKYSEHQNHSVNPRFNKNSNTTTRDRFKIKQEIDVMNDTNYYQSDSEANGETEEGFELNADSNECGQDNSGEEEPISNPARLKSENLSFEDCEEVEKDNQAVPLGLFLNNAHFLQATEQMDTTDEMTDDKIPGGDVELEHHSLISANGKDVPVSKSSHEEAMSSQTANHREKKVYPKPTVVTSTLIAVALKNSKNGYLSSPEIYEFICNHFPFYKTAPNGWKNVVRCRLSASHMFVKVHDPRQKQASGNGNLWTMNPAVMSRLDSELSRWLLRPPVGLSDCFKHPAKLLALVKGRFGLITSKRTSSKTEAPLKKADRFPAAATQRQVHPIHPERSHSKAHVGSQAQTMAAIRSKLSHSTIHSRQPYSPVSHHNVHPRPSSRVGGSTLLAQRQLPLKPSGSGSGTARSRLGHHHPPSHIRQTGPPSKQHDSGASPHLKLSPMKASASSASWHRQEMKTAIDRYAVKKKLLQKSNLDHRKQHSFENYSMHLTTGKRTVNMMQNKRKMEEKGKDGHPKRSTGCDEDPTTTKNKRKKRTWVHPLNEARDVDGVMAKLYPQLVEDDEKFYDFTKMTRGSFEELLARMGDQISRMDTNFRKAIPPRERLLLTLRFLVSGESSRSLHHQFQIGVSTVRDIIYGACDAICNSLKDSELPRLTEESFKTISANFYKKWKYPHCIGAVGCRAINLQIPGSADDSSENQKGKKIYIGLQGVVDSDGNFISVDVVDLSRNFEGCILKQSDFGEALYKNHLPIPQPDKSLVCEDELDEPLPYVFLGDNRQPHMKLLMRPFPERSKDDVRRYYNDRHSRARRIVDCVFEGMMAKWGVLRDTVTMNLYNAYKVVLACCVLHNFLKNREGGGILKELPVKQKSRRKRAGDPLSIPISGRPSQEAIRIRDRFAKLLSGELFDPALKIPDDLPTNTLNISAPNQSISLDAPNTPDLSIPAQSSARDNSTASNLSLPIPNNSSNLPNTSDIAVPTDNSATELPCTSELPLSTQSSSIDAPNMTDLSAPAQNILTDISNPSELSFSTQSNSKDLPNASALSLATQNSSIDARDTLNLCVSTQNTVTGVSNTHSPSHPSQICSSDLSNTSNATVPGETNSMELPSTSTLELQVHLSTQTSSVHVTNTSNISVPTQNISMDFSNPSDFTHSTQNNSTDLSETSNISVPTQNNSTDLSKTSNISVPTQNNSIDLPSTSTSDSIFSQND